MATQLASKQGCWLKTDYELNRCREVVTEQVLRSDRKAIERSVHPIKLFCRDLDVGL